MSATHIQVYDIHFQCKTDYLKFLRPFLLLHFITHPPFVQSYFYPSTMGFTHPNDGWTSLHKSMYPPKVNFTHTKENGP